MCVRCGCWHGASLRQGCHKTVGIFLCYSCVVSDFAARPMHTARDTPRFLPWDRMAVCFLMACQLHACLSALGVIALTDHTQKAELVDGYTGGFALQ